MQRNGFCLLDDESEEQKADLETKTLIVRDRRLLASLWRIFPYVYRLNDGSAALLQQVCKERGWKEFGETAIRQWDEVSVRGSQCWNLRWRSSIMNPNRVTHLKNWQITNHIPNASNFCRKDVLARYLRRLKITYKAIYDYSPLSFNLPLEYTRLLGEHARRISLLEYGSPEGDDTPFGKNHYLPKGKKAPIWIAKPIGKSQGKGITVLDHPAEFSYDEPCVVQEYIYRPFLINGYKWDLRLYVCITCPNPLTIYAYREGITRFATKKYDLNDLYNTFSHLTNTAVNKQSPTYKKNKETIGYGCKWTLKKLRNYFKQRGQSDYYLWQRIWSILILTIIGDGKDISRLEWNNSSFEFFGFDILVDELLKPHLLEVNVNPGLGSDTISAVDEEVKKPLLHHLFNLLGLPDGQVIGDTDNEHSIGCDIHEDLLIDEDIILEKMLLSSKEVNSLSIQKGYAHILESLVNQDNPDLIMNRVGTAKPWSRLQSRPYTRSKRDKELLSGRARMSYERCVTRQLLGPDIQLPRKSKRKNKCENKQLMPDQNMIPPVTVRVPVLKGQRERIKSRYPKNGPGMNLASRNWDKESPISCGSWVKIFPFDKVTEDKCRFNTEDSIRSSITQVTEYLKLVKEVVRNVESTCRLDDDFYDAKIKESGLFATDVWYPYL